MLSHFLCSFSYKSTVEFARGYMMCNITIDLMQKQVKLFFMWHYFSLSDIFVDMKSIVSFHTQKNNVISVNT